MNKELFIQYLHNPTAMDEASIANLSEIVTEYPYFQTAHLLYIKSLHDNKSIRYPSQLKMVAAYVGDRSMLFRLIKQHAPKPEPVTPIKVVHPPKPIVEAAPLSETQEVSLVSSVSNDDLIDFDFGIETETPKQAPSVLEIQPQFLDYVYNLEQKPPIVPEVAVAKPKRTAQLIDAFIERSPRIIPKASMDEELPPQEDISTPYVAEPDFMTETLAEIYIRQKNYAKAANIYQKLILIYPQKSIYFAQKIEQLKELSIQQ